MPTWEERHARARLHVVKGQHIIERQRVLIERQKAFGADTAESEKLLVSFERSQAMFEDDLTRIEQERE